MRTGIALGSNVGDRLSHLRSGREQILAISGVAEPVLSSALYETEAIGAGAGANSFFNAVVEVEFTGQSNELLDELQRVEAVHGRPSKRPRDAPRTLDLDILYLGNFVLSNQDFVIPHPRLHLRRFVLQPLADIRPELVLPGQHDSVAQLLSRLADNAAVELRLANW